MVQNLLSGVAEPFLYASLLGTLLALAMVVGSLFPRGRGARSE